MKLAWIDPAAAVPSRVRGFFAVAPKGAPARDDELDYPDLPPGAELVEMTPEQWEARGTACWWTGAGFAPPPADDRPAGAPPDMARLVPKILVVRRMRARGTLGQVLALLDADPLDKAEWDAAGSHVPAGDARLRAMIAAAGDDPDAVLRPGEGV